MRPHQQFRYWARRAPAGERVAVGAAVIGLLALLAVVVAPADEGPGSEHAVSAGVEQSADGAANEPSGLVDGTVAPSADLVSGVSPAVAAPSSTGAQRPAVDGEAATAAQPVAESSGGCTPPAGGARGVTDDKVKIAVTLTEVIGPAANQTFGLPSTDEQRGYYEAVIDAVNAEGGVGCRELEAHYYAVNPADQTDQHEKCLQIAEAGVFAELDFTAYIGNGDCFAQRQIPYFVSYFIYASKRDRFYPYLFGMQVFDELYRDTVFALRDRGTFDPKTGFEKLGFIYRSCDRPLIQNFMSWLREAGLSTDQIVTYDVGCPALYATPSDLQQAVLKFQQSGVTHVTTAYFLGDFGNFTKIAQRQGFRPRYVLGDDGTINQTYGGNGPDPQNIADAIAITTSRWGEERTPGVPLHAATAKCNEILQKRGFPPIYEHKSAAGGRVCNEVWMFVAAANHAPKLEPGALAEGLRRAKSIDFSFPNGPNDFTGDRVTAGGQFWRTTEFKLDCSCWRLAEAEFHPTYK